MYYTGTKQECESYNAIVTQGEKYQSSTGSWSTILEHKNGVEFAIIRNEKYSSELELLTELPNDWFPEI